MSFYLHGSKWSILCRGKGANSKKGATQHFWKIRAEHERRVNHDQLYLILDDAMIEKKPQLTQKNYVVPFKKQNKQRKPRYLPFLFGYTYQLIGVEDLQRLKS